MSAPVRSLQRGATRAFSQSSCTLTPRSGVASSSSNFTRTKHNKRQKRKKDDILRKAVEMYHLTPSFLPSPQRAAGSTAAGRSAASSSSSAEWESALDNTIYSSILNTDSVSRRSPNLVPRGLAEYSREQSIRAASVPAFGNTDQLESSAANDMDSFASHLTSTTFLTRREREAAAAGSTSAGSSESIEGASLQNGGGLEHFTDADIAMYQRRHTHGAGVDSSTGLDSSRYSGAERLTHLDRITPGGNEWYRSQGLDTRSARVRDAIFGTVNGELPGLDVVRERIARMRRENASQAVSSD